MKEHGTTPGERQGGQGLEQWLPALEDLRRLGRVLAGDSNVGDDLAHEALLTAASSGAHAAPEPSFARGVLRNLWRRERSRRSAAALAHRRLAESRPLAPAADDVLERAEVLELILAEIRALPKAQSRSILRRYVDGWSVACIARTDGVAASTVRANIARGLATLRQRLDRRVGSRPGWALPLVGAGGMGNVPVVLAVLFLAAATGLAAVMLQRDATVAGPLATLQSEREPLVHADSEPAFPSLAENTPAPSKERVLALVDDPVEAQTAPPQTEPEVHVIRGRVIDSRTGEPIPSLDVKIDWRRRIFVNLDAVTDELGWFEVEVASALPSEARIRLVDGGCMAGHPSDWMYGIRDTPLPMKEPLEIEIGPRYPVRFPAGLVQPLQGHVLVAAGDPDLEPVRVAFHDGAEAWIRLPWPLPPAYHSIRASTEDPFTVAVGSIPERPGVPIEITLERRGTAEFLLEGPGVVRAVPMALIADDGTVHRRFAPSGGTGLLAPARFELFPPGHYRWEAGLAARHGAGEVDVVAGEVVRVGLDGVDQRGESITIHVDASLVPEFEPSGSFAGLRMFTPVEFDDPRGLALEPTGTDGQYALRVEHPGPGRWFLCMGHSQYVVEPPCLEIDPDPEFAFQTVRIMPAVERSAIRVDAVDAVTGEPIPGATASFQANGQHGNQQLDESAGYIDLPLDLAPLLRVDADGYDMRTVETTGRKHMDIITVHLERGERTRLHVLEVPWMRPVAGLRVIADNVVLGPTDAHGAIWLEREPLHVEIDPANEAFVELERHSASRAGTRGILLFAARR